VNKTNRKPRHDSLKKPLSSKREWVFRVVAALVVPLVVLLAVELGLRSAGFGYSPHFFTPAEREQIFAENPKFGWRFFPRHLARAPDPIRLAKAKPEGTCRIFVFGESAALGDPEPAYGFSRIMRELLEEQCPGTKFEIVNVGMTAISSHAVRDIARDCVPFHGDIWIIYMGNNEVVGPFGAGSVFGLRTPPYWLVRASLLLKRTRVGQMLDGLADWTRLRQAKSRRWEGMQMMVNEQIRASEPSLRRVYDHFDRNLRDIISTATKSGAKPIVCSVTSNLKDCPPFASLNKTTLSGEPRMSWTNLFSSGKELEARHEYVGALAQYGRAAQIDDTFAELPFRTARCYLAMGEAARAKECYARARDLDALRFRADARINTIIDSRCASGAQAGVRFFDSEAVVTNLCQSGIPGAECFWDHVHFNFAGNYRIARGLAEQVLSALPNIASKSHSNFLAEADCAARLAFTDWDQRQVREQMWQRVQRVPFTDQVDHDKSLERWSERRNELRRSTDGPGLKAALEIYRSALQRRPEDWILHHRMAFALEAAGQLAEAAAHWKKVVEMIPDYVDAYFKLGDVSSRQSRPAEAERYYREVLRLRPNSTEALNGIGLLRMAEGKSEEAEQLFRRALWMLPGFAQAEVNLGLVLAKRGDLAKAEEAYREALRNDPQSIGARVNLANLLAAKKQHTPAIEQYVQALKLQPEQPTVHFALANSLQASGRDPEAVAHYREAIRYEPAFAEAHFNLGLTLAREGDFQSATACFQETIRLRPEDSQARVNLGVALARQNRLDEAISQFQAVLRSDSNNAAAKQYLQTAISRRGTTP